MHQKPQVVRFLVTLRLLVTRPGVTGGINGRASSSDCPDCFPFLGLGIFRHLQTFKMHLMMMEVAEVDAVVEVGSAA
ncbi:MAG: hypothetical protein ACTIKB_08845, partial [Agrococcus casei]|uniref:hypothetical protein n=1 Tax=Agrococcus casei TaxID=343512 RepID=UPI003F9C14C3